MKEEEKAIAELTAAPAADQTCVEICEETGSQIDLITINFIFQTASVLQAFGNGNGNDHTCIEICEETGRQIDHQYTARQLAQTANSLEVDRDEVNVRVFFLVLHPTRLVWQSFRSSRPCYPLWQRHPKSFDKSVQLRRTRANSCALPLPSIICFPFF